MSWQAERDVWEYSKAEGYDLLVLLAIANHINQATGEGWPGYGRIAKRCKITLRAAKEIVRRLCKSGELVILERGGGRVSNRYCLNLTKQSTGGAVEDGADDESADGAESGAGVAAGSNEPWNVSLGEMGPDGNATILGGAFPDAKNEVLPPHKYEVGSKPVGALFDEAGKGDITPKSSTKTGTDPHAGLTPGQRYFLEAFGAHRYKTKAQKEAVAAMEEIYSFEKLKGAVDWAAKMGMNLGRAVVSVESALKKNGGNKAANGNGRTKVDAIGGRTVIR